MGPSQFVYCSTDWNHGLVSPRSHSLSLPLCFSHLLPPPAQPHSWDEADCSDKFEECSALFSTDHPENQQEMCSLLNRTIQCFMNYSTHSCIGNSLNAAAQKNMAIEDFCSHDYCIPGTASEEECSSLFENISTPSPQPSDPQSCDTLPPIFHSGQLVNLSSPSLDLPPSPASPPECTLPDHLTYYRQHCSAFSLSHIRPFGDRSLALQTCTLFGEWYLLMHESLSVSVLGVPRLSNSDFYDNFYTYISEVIYGHNILVSVWESGPLVGNQHLGSLHTSADCNPGSC